MMKNVLAVATALACGVAFAKLAPLDDAAKAKAAETAAKAAWQAKVDAWQLCKVQDRIAAKYRSSSAKTAAVPASGMKPVSMSAPTAIAAGSASAAKAATAPTAAASAAPTTPVAGAAPAPCVDPGAFAYTPPEQKPLETSAAHSPTGTAISPPSVRPEAATMTPGATGTPKK